MTKELTESKRIFKELFLITYQTYKLTKDKNIERN